jgi:tol-pal system protein YbgF
MRNLPTVIVLVLGSLIATSASGASWRSRPPEPEKTEAAPAATTPAATTTVSRDTLLELLDQLESLQNEVRQLRNLVEVQGNELKQLQTRTDDIGQDLDRRLRRVERGGTAAEAPAKDGAPAAAVAPTVTAPPSGNEQQDYEAAFQLMKRGDYTAASQAFRSFIIKYPGSSLSDNAQYWIAESNYFTRNFQLALKEFLLVMEKYPESGKVPDAMLKAGYTYYELGDWANARKYLGDIIARYPNTRLARSAQSRLDLMKKEGH